MKKNRKCPKCGSEEIAEVVYGWIPAPSEEMSRRARAGKIHYGGCCVSPDSPRWHCNDCEHGWGKVRM